MGIEVRTMLSGRAVERHRVVAALELLCAGLKLGEIPVH